MSERTRMVGIQTTRVTLQNWAESYISAAENGK